MIRSPASWVLISAIAISAPFVLPSAVAPFSASAHAAGQLDPGVAVSRIEGVFASLADVAVDPAIATAAVRAAKGDIVVAPACVGAVWPNIDAACLATADGRPASRVRSITFGYPAGENTTVLIRFPTAEVAQR
jgi:hypothetical protein